mgnify:CR=1 FL=1
MPGTKNDPGKINLFRLSMIILVVVINKGASNANSCPDPHVGNNNYNGLIVADCVV